MKWLALVSKPLDSHLSIIIRVFGENLKVRLLDYKLESFIRIVCVKSQEALIKS